MKAPLAALGLTLGLVGGAAGDAARPRDARAAEPLRIALSGVSASVLPVYVAADGILAAEGLAASLVTLFSAGVAQAVVGRSADVGVTSFQSLVAAIAAGHRVKAFYAGFAQAELEWLAAPRVRRWEDLRGGSISVAPPGGLVVFLTGHVLRRHGLEPGRDVRLVYGGRLQNRWAALRSGRVDAAALFPPTKWHALETGYTRLGTQATEIAPEWPRAVFWARDALLDERADAIRALLRAHVRAVRLVRADPAGAVDVLTRVLKYRRVDAERAYREVVGGFDERGRLPVAGLAAFWPVAVAAGEVEAPWPEARFFDRRFVDTFEAWAPR